MLSHNLPVQSTPFIGRTRELAEFSRLLADPTCRLLTLVGQGGIGKTRLALQAAQHIVDGNGGDGDGNGNGLNRAFLSPKFFPHGVYFVALQPLSSSHYIVSAISDALGIQFSPSGEPMQQLLEYLREKSILLILDNFEHLLDSAGVEMVTLILSHAPGVKILTTSRETLNLQEEWLYHVRGMNFPESQMTAEIESYGAVRLFKQSAERVRADFSLANEQDAVIRICKLVEGLPLALEITAAWLKRLPCDEIADELARGLDILETPTRNAPLRHRSMRVVFEQSWDLLTESERDVFKKLSVFRGGFRKEAPQAVAGATLAILSGLVDKSLVRMDENGRYDLHELLRQYGEEHLNVSPEEGEQVRDLHAAYYADFMHRLEADIKGQRQRAGLDEVEADFENIRAAWLWALGRGNFDVILRASESLFLVCEIHGRFVEGRELFWQAQSQIAAQPGDQQPLIRARIASRGIWLWKLQGDAAGQREAIRVQIEETLATAEQCGDRALAGYSLWLLAAYCHFRRENDRAIHYLQQSLPLLLEIGDLFYAARAADWMGAIYGSIGQKDKCVQYSEQSLNLRRATGDQFGAAAALMNLVGISLLNGKYAECERYAKEMGAMYRAIGSRVWAARESAFMSMISLQTGDFLKAEALAHDVLEIVTDAGTAAAEGGAIALSVLGLLAALQEAHTKSWQIFERIASGLGPPEPLAHHGLTIAALGLEEFDAARTHLLMCLITDVTSAHLPNMAYAVAAAALMLAHEGRIEKSIEVLSAAYHHPASAKKWLETWPPLMRLRDQAQAELGAEVYDAAWRRGEAADMESVAARLLEMFQNSDAEPDQLTVDGNRSLDEPLSERELEVLRLIRLGLSNEQIAQQLVVGVSTVKKHINHIFAKLDAKSRTQAIVRAEQLSIL